MALFPAFHFCQSKKLTQWLEDMIFFSRAHIFRPPSDIPSIAEMQKQLSSQYLTRQEIFWRASSLFKTAKILFSILVAQISKSEWQRNIFINEFAMKTDPYRCTLFPLFCNNENSLVKNRQASRKWHFRHFKNGNIKMSTLKIGRRESHTYQNKTRCPLQEVIFDDSTIFMQVQRIFFNQSFVKLNRPFIQRLVSKKIAELSSYP